MSTPRSSVPPGSTPLSELAHAIDQALTLPEPAERRISQLLTASRPGQDYSEYASYLRVLRDRSQKARKAIQRLLSEHAETHDHEVSSLRAQLGDSRPPEPS